MLMLSLSRSKANTLKFLGVPVVYLPPGLIAQLHRNPQELMDAIKKHRAALDCLLGIETVIDRHEPALNDPESDGYDFDFDQLRIDAYWRLARVLRGEAAPYEFSQTTIPPTADKGMRPALLSGFSNLHEILDRATGR